MELNRRFPSSMWCCRLQRYINVEEAKRILLNFVALKLKQEKIIHESRVNAENSTVQRNIYENIKRNNEQALKVKHRKVIQETISNAENSTAQKNIYENIKRSNEAKRAREILVTPGTNGESTDKRTHLCFFKSHCPDPKKASPKPHSPSKKNTSPRQKKNTSQSKKNKNPSPHEPKKPSPRSKPFPCAFITNPELVKTLLNPNFKFDNEPDDPVFKHPSSQHVNLASSASPYPINFSSPPKNMFHFDYNDVADWGLSSFCKFP